MLSSSKVSVFVINFNGEKLLRNCINSVLSSECNNDIELIVVDNASTDNSLKILQEYKNEIVIVQNFDNSGFSRANNIAAKYASGNVYFLLNNDTILKKDTIQKSLDFLISDEKIGILSPKLLNADGSVQCPGSILGQWRFRSSSPIEVPFIAGAAVFIKKDIYEKIGGLDENLYFYNDDIDLCKNIKKIGYKILYFPYAELTHIGGVSTKFRKNHTMVEGYRGGFYICKKHYGTFLFFIYRWLVCLDVIPKFIYYSVASIFYKKKCEMRNVFFKIMMLNLKSEFTVNYPPLRVKKW